MPRPIHLLHDAAALARMLALEAPCCAQIAMSAAGTSATGTPTAWGAFLDANPLGDAWIADTELPARRIVSYSGTLADTPFGDDPRTWMKAGHERFRAFCDEVEPSLRAHGRTLCFRPHHPHRLGRTLYLQYLRPCSIPYSLVGVSALTVCTRWRARLRTPRLRLK